MFGALKFLPLYQQAVQGASATGSGLLLIPMMLGMPVTSLFAGQVITKTGHYKAQPMIGGVIMTAGMVLLAGLEVRHRRLSPGVSWWCSGWAWAS